MSELPPFDHRHFPRCDQAPAWSALKSHRQDGFRGFDVREAFKADPGRFDFFSLEACGIFADLSKAHMDRQAQALLIDLARQCEVAAQRDAMWAGEKVNTTEDRAALHYLLRYPARGAAWTPAGLAGLSEDRAEVKSTLQAMLDFAERVRADGEITTIVNIGIGGSDLGPQMATVALKRFTSTQRQVLFLSNIDGHDLENLVRPLDPRKTLFLVASKTFTTLETLTNAHSAREWFLSQGGTDVARHFVGLTSNVEAAREFGITTTFDFRDWVGGRYSLWSAIGLPIAIAVGAEHFRALLAGAHAMDAHFATAPLESNLPLRLALLDVWYRNFLGYTSRSIAPYHAGLRRLPAHLQQLEMESNGKGVDRSGRPLTYATAPVVWGEPGTNGQHAYFEMLHQGPDVIPVEFIAVKEAPHSLPAHHDRLLANALAQAQALMIGRHDTGGHRHFPGNRPSTFLLLERMDPASLGALVALYEHHVFCAGAIWGINSFDQWGVELGKSLSKDLMPRLATGDTQGLDASTAGLLRRMARRPAG